jgi:hypothetical protein
MPQVGLRPAQAGIGLQEGRKKACAKDLLLAQPGGRT